MESPSVIESEEKVETHEPEPEFSPEIKGLLVIRKRFVQGKEYRGIHISPEGVRKEWSFRSAFELLESNYFDFDAAGYSEDILDALKEKIGEEPWKMYFEPALELHRKGQYIWRAIERQDRKLKEEDKWQRCGGDPNEIVYKDITRLQIFDAFSMDKTYSVNAIAGNLGLTYMQAYMNVVPWMKGEGFNVK